MNQKNNIHLQGFIRIYDNEVMLDDDYTMLSRELGNRLYKSNQERSNYDKGEGTTEDSLFIPNVFLRIYASDKKISLDEVVEKDVRKMSGDLDLLTEWYGYSEYTIEGYDTVNFTLGNHHLDQLFKAYEGKYVHILVEVKE